jgi:hypothetical protein
VVVSFGTIRKRLASTMAQSLRVPESAASEGGEFDARQCCFVSHMRDNHLNGWSQ